MLTWVKSRTLWPSTLPIVALLVVASMAFTSSPPQAGRTVRRELREELLDYSSTGWMAEQEADRVVALPGQPRVGFAMYAGYITVNKEAGRAHYYYFVEAAEEPQTKPLAFWFNGGPGCSSIAYGFAQELGPFFVNPGRKTLRLNPNAGNKHANIVFVESPAGVGFSYSNTTSDNYASGDNRTAHDNYAFVVNWMERFPLYKGRPFYLTGESYAGFYIPQLAKMIFDNNKKLSQNNRINFKGFMVGNPMIERQSLYRGNVDYLYYHAMIIDALCSQIKTACNFKSENQTLPDSCLQLVWPGVWENYGLLYLRTGHFRMEQYDPCTQAYSSIYFNRPDVQKAMHANTTGIPYPWVKCSDPLFSNWTDTATSVLPIYQELLEAGLRLWVFSGDADSIVSTTSTRYALASLNLPVVVPWYAWYNELQVGGREIVYQGNLTLVTVRGAGHEVPLLKPQEFLQVFSAFLNASFLPSEPYES